MSRFHNENTQAKISEYIGGFGGKKIAYIPTADNAEEGWGDWKKRKNGSWALINTLGAKVNTVVLEEYRNDTVLKELEDKDVIWFAGGMPGYLAYWMRRCKIDLALPKLLQKSLYVGSSAGAMVVGQTLEVAEWGFGGDNERGGSSIKPLKLVDFDIFPHFKNELLPIIKRNYKGKKIYLIKDDEQIIVEGDKVKVMGEERIITYG